MGYTLDWHETIPQLLMLVYDEEVDKQDIIDSFRESFTTASEAGAPTYVIVDVSRRPTPPAGTLGAVSTTFPSRPKELEHLILTGTDRLGYIFGNIVDKTGLGGGWFHMAENLDEALEFVREAQEAQ